MPPERIASSSIMDQLFGDTTRFRTILQDAIRPLIEHYGGTTALPAHFLAIPDRIICICPMVLCHAFLADLNIQAPIDLLGPLGLSMYSISTHDDVVDESPKDRGVVAGLVYSGNIASLHGISLLFLNGYARVAQKIIQLMNLNHCFQTDIAFSLWTAPSDEATYFEAISHTGYWAAIGPVAAAEYAALQNDARNDDFQHFAQEFGTLYGRMCQVYDDMREIDDDRKNGYFSLPISIAMHHGYDLDSAADRERSIARPREIAGACFQDICNLCDTSWPSLFKLANQMHQVGQSITYS